MVYFRNPSGGTWKNIMKEHLVRHGSKHKIQMHTTKSNKRQHKQKQNRTHFQNKTTTTRNQRKIIIALYIAWFAFIKRLHLMLMEALNHASFYRSLMKRIVNARDISIDIFLPGGRPDARLFDAVGTRKKEEKKGRKKPDVKWGWSRHLHWGVSQ